MIQQKYEEYHKIFNLSMESVDIWTRTWTNKSYCGDKSRIPYIKYRWQLSDFVVQCYTVNVKESVEYLFISRSIIFFLELNNIWIHGFWQLRNWQKVHKVSKSFSRAKLRYINLRPIHAFLMNIEEWRLYHHQWLPLHVCINGMAQTIAEAG